jgi:hypothetical protein
VHSADPLLSPVDLVRLRLIDVKLSKTQCRPLKALKVLSVDYVILCYNTWFLDPEFFPALKALRFEGDFREGRRSGVLEQIGLPQLLGQLDLIECDLTLYRLLSEFDSGALLSILPPRSLVRVATHNLRSTEYKALLSTIYQMRLSTSFPFGILGKSMLLKRLFDWVDVDLSDTPHRLRFLYLDPILFPTSDDGNPIHVKWQTIQAKCGRLGIELVYEDQSGDSANFVSEEFWRRQKEARSSLRSQ